MALEQRFRPSVMGIVNVTPDSFSDGGVTSAPRTRSARRGGWSTRGSDRRRRRSRPDPGPRACLWKRSQRRAGAGESRRPSGLDRHREGRGGPPGARARAEMVNDVTALRADPGLAEVAAEADAYVCLMHMQGEPRTMQANPTYDDVVSDVKRFLEERVQFAVDPGSRGPDLHRSRHRVREDRRAQLRADPPARRDRRARPAGRRRVLAQELARQDPRRPRRTTGRSRPASRRR